MIKPEIQTSLTTVYQGDCRAVLAQLPPDSVDCVVTSPPYWLPRQYDIQHQIWGEVPGCQHDWKTQRYYAEAGVSGAKGARKIKGGKANADRVRKARWRQYSYCTECGAYYGELGQEPVVDLYVQHLVEVFAAVRRVLKPTGTLWVNLGDTYHKKNLSLVPARAAIALQDDGWTLRNEIVWQKPSGDRTHGDRLPHSTEKIYLFTKVGERQPYHFDNSLGLTDVWSVAPSSNVTAHTAVMPRTVAANCIMAGCPSGGVVLDPFAGSGVTLAVAQDHGRRAIGIELNSYYISLIFDRVRQESLFGVAR